MGLEAKTDTSVLAELRKPRPHPAVIAWYEGVADDELFEPTGVALLNLFEA